MRGDHALALRLYRELAADGDASAQFKLGRMYAEGLGAPQNDAQAVHWYRRAAQQGHASAQVNLGVMYGEGLGVPQDDAQAAHWFRRAAEQGDASAQSILGVMYAEGRGVPQDDAQAVHWYRRAAEKGDAFAQYGLGWMYAEGRGVPQDDAQAAHWYRRAAEQGDASAQFNLGVMYAEGLGVPQDDAQAEHWWRRAAEQGHEPAAYALDRRAAAQTEAREWQPGAGAVPRGEPLGSGFRVAPGRIVTNAHVVTGCPQILIGNQRATRRAADAVNDLALIELPGDRGAVAPLRPAAARLGEGVTIAGFPLEGLFAGLSVTSGNVSRLSGLGGDTGQLQISAPVQPGNSGGPVLDSAAQVIGVVVSKLDALKVARAIGDLPQNVNFAIKGEVLRAFLEAHDVDYASSPGARPKGTAAVAERAQQFTVLIECAR
jgi:TPR repeat protein